MWNNAKSKNLGNGWSADVDFNLNLDLGCHSAILTNLHIDLCYEGFKEHPPSANYENWSEYNKLWRAWGERRDAVAKKAKQEMEVKGLRTEAYNFALARVLSQLSQSRPQIIFSDRIGRDDYDDFLDSEGPSSYLSVGRTYDFARWLIQNKHGTITSSHATHNPGHNEHGDFSVTRVWVWTPSSLTWTVIKEPSKHIRYAKEALPLVQWREQMLKRHKDNRAKKAFTVKELQQS